MFEIAYAQKETILYEEMLKLLITVFKYLAPKIWDLVPDKLNIEDH